MRKLYSSDATPHLHLQPCAWKGCESHGAYPAPRAPQRLRDYHWFCLEHIRQYNKSWDYLAALSPTQAEAFRRDSVYGHRPTWKMGVNAGAETERLYAAWEAFAGDAPSYSRTLPQTERDALAALNLRLPVTLADIKRRYKTLVKRYHPDVNKNDKRKEEQFKIITHAYHCLRQCGYYT